MVTDSLWLHPPRVCAESTALSTTGGLGDRRGKGEAQRGTSHQVHSRTERSREPARPSWTVVGLGGHMFLGAFRLVIDSDRCLHLPSGFLPIPLDHEGRVGLLVEACALPLEPGLRLWHSAKPFMAAREHPGFAELDRMGKLWLPEGQYLESRLGQDVVLLGNFDFIEIWDPEA